MVSVIQKQFVVSDWFDRIEIVEGRFISEAVSKFLGSPVATAVDRNQAIAFACELTDEVKKIVFSKDPRQKQSDALEALPGTRYYIKASNKS
ncbi:hypothetical protein DET50_113123 [Marinobacter pelagius]|uniref:Uncharacterized protein n=1 Tax=Marinobacter pelagius TaxID=379482 RepID=A0A366GMT3_9GAMM|nr:hypothetical protein [Marinobacter pelagius]RBP27922.1 hypothetical protein DET50_113123 [Marinobacter pelagius]